MVLFFINSSMTMSFQNFIIARIKRSTVVLGKRNKSTKDCKTDGALVSLEESRRFIVECMECVGTPKNHADILADSLVEADYRGFYNYGIKQLDVYVYDIISKTCNACATPEIIKEKKATAWVDGKNGLGSVVANFCMDIAIEKAKRVGVGWVAVKGSNHFGIAGMYSTRALCQGLLGLCFSNTSPYMCPTRSKQPALGTNPFSLGAPASKADGFLLDMTTTTVDFGKIEEYKNQKKKIPKGWAMDCEGEVTQDATVAYESGCLMPLGGSELHSGYNGYGLGLMVEAFCGILAGAQFGPNIRKWGDVSTAANLGQSFVAINPNCFAPGFLDRMGKHISYIRCMEPADPAKPVMIHGDPERLHMEAVDKAGGVRYGKEQMEVCQRLASTLDVPPIKVCSWLRISFLLRVCPLR